MERLSDERLRMIAKDNTTFHYEATHMASELLDLRASLSAGPAMPETPGEKVRWAIDAVLPGGHLCSSLQDDELVIYAAIREALMKEQGL